MNAKRRERLLRQVTRLREIEHRTAAAAASQALSEAVRSRHLAERAASLVEGYSDFSTVTNAHELAARRFAGERMRNIAVQTGAAADTAAAIAETRVVGERQARRKREAIEEARVRLVAETPKVLAGGYDAPRGGLARFLNNDPANHRGT